MAADSELFGAEDRSVQWTEDVPGGAVRLIDQRELPLKLCRIECRTVGEAADAIRRMAVRGAPAIGAAAAYAMAVAARRGLGGDGDGDGGSGGEGVPESAADVVSRLEAAKAVLDAARPTAVNLSWATARMLRLARALADRGVPGPRAAAAILLEAGELADDDVRVNRAIGAHGAALVPDGANLLHHCNTGSLATVHYGTALGIVYACHERGGKGVHVWVDETRPRLQGARLTAWELMRAGVPMHLIADSASGMLMRAGRVDAVVFGADRVAANGDTANKIGTYNACVVARENGVPTYAAVPTSTVDPEVATGDSIEIEERAAEEVAEVRGVRVAPDGVRVFNPAFDVTPARYITAIVTEEGVCHPPFADSLRDAKKRAEERAARGWAERLEKYLSA